MKRLLHILALGFPCITSMYGNNNIEQMQIQPVVTPTMLLASISDEIKKAEYLQEILPNNFSYLKQLLQQDIPGKNRVYTRSVFRLFGNMLKGTQYVNAYIFKNLIGELPSLVKDDFVLYKTSVYVKNKSLLELDLFDRSQEAISNMMFLKFNTHFDYFKQDPEKFLDELAQQIVVLIEDEVNLEQLRQTIIKFLEIGIGKMVWNPEEHDMIWESTKQIAQNLTNLMEHNIIDDVGDLDDLFWTLIHRFCFLLDITGNQMPVTFYERIKNDVASQSLLLLELEEQESFLETKYSFLMRNVLISEAKRRAHDAGMLIS